MITGPLKSEIDKLWLTFWSNGISNSFTVIEQISYLIFLKQIDKKQMLAESKAARTGKAVEKPIYPEKYKALRWSSFVEDDPETLFEKFTRPDKELELTVFDFIRQVGVEGSEFTKHMKGATFMIQTAYLLDKAVQSIESMFEDTKFGLDSQDVKGDLYEYLLSKIAEAGTNGQFRTPRHIIRMMVHLMKPQIDDTIADPSCGTAGFLVESNAYIQQTHSKAFADPKFIKHYKEKMFNGTEFDPGMMRVAAMNLMLHGIETPRLLATDALSKDNTISDEYSLILANPPFKGSLDYDQVEPTLLTMVKTKKTELLFLALMLRQLEIGGRCAVIIPDGVLFGSSKAHKSIRKEIVATQHLHAVISLPSGVFKPYAGVSTAILIFTKTESAGTDQVWFYDMKADGYTLNDNRNPLLDFEAQEASFNTPAQVAEAQLEKSNIADILLRYPAREGKEKKNPRTAQSFTVPLKEIQENDYDLSINRYKEIIYEEVAYDEPKVILERIRSLSKEREELIKLLN